MAATLTVGLGCGPLLDPELQMGPWQMLAKREAGCGLRTQLWS